MEERACEIIKDLMPLYYDKVCSLESSKWVEEHLAECRSCRLEMDKIKLAIRLPQEVIEQNDREGEALKGIAVLWNRSKAKAFAIGLLGAALLFGGYVGLFQWEVRKVSAGVIELSEVSQLPDGRIAYHAKLTDGYSVNRIKYEMDKDGNFYLTPLRPIIKTKPISETFLNLIDTLDHEKLVYKEKYGDKAEIQAVYFRTSDEDILIWKKGMELKAASDELEAKLRQ
ncbi:zf-HC2 domain-containing protein [Paenibacillus aurantius]|uniref:Zf-HC2 domain-containing protein n=1 Tax=Paenibacillus aurantius TaxID=2918900 RepID=A0AA96LGJ7_9BACL|nr:zf-HC2 domain-containing protein [Paenibacillus aurantius]WNQ11102.1 zf-HC2 domain-containing protein [Paenibacillus aurantius]